MNENVSGAGQQGDSGSQGDSGAKQGGDLSAEVERIKGENEKLRKDLEETRLEIMTPEYIEFLNAKESGAKPRAEEPAKPAEVVDFSKMTPDQIYAKAKADAIAEAKKEVESLKQSLDNDSKERTRREVEAFSKTHADFELYRPTMYGLSIRPDNANATLQDLYEQAKDIVRRAQVGDTEADKERKRRSGGEKPAGASHSFKQQKRYTADEAADEAWNEVVGDGALPPAI